MNAAFLLLASAWSAGQPAPAPAANPAPHHGGSACCDNHRGRFWDRCRQWFQRDRCRDHQHCKPVCHTVCRQVCQPACRPCPPCPRVTCAKPCPPPACHDRNRCRDRCRDHCREQCRQRHHDCDHGCGGGFLDRLRGLFRRHNDCCDNWCGRGGAVGPRSGEPIPAPKKMPGGQPSEVRIISPPAGAVPAAAPALEVVPANPAIVPPADIEIRNPF